MAEKDIMRAFTNFGEIKCDGFVSATLTLSALKITFAFKNKLLIKKFKCPLFEVALCHGSDAVSQKYCGKLTN